MDDFDTLFRIGLDCVCSPYIFDDSFVEFSKCRLSSRLSLSFRLLLMGYTQADL